MNNSILAPYQQKGLKLKNHLVMAPMTRSRAIGNIPNNLMAQYYGQRTGAGLIVTEGTSPSPNGLGYARIPGIFSAAQVEGWKKVTGAVHAGNSKIFVQLMHTGRIAHQANLPQSAQVVGVSTIKAAGQMHTDSMGMQDYPTPVVLTTDGVKATIAEYVQAAQNAVAAGFDGVEIHGANGYLVEQFLNPNVNNRTDQYGGDYKARASFALQVAQQIADAIGKEKVAIRFSPFSTLGDLPEYDTNEVHNTYVYLAQELNKIGITYIHIGLSPKIQQQTFDAIREAFTETIILCNGNTPDNAADTLAKGFADVLAFGRPFLANPDFDIRISQNAPLNDVDFTTLYTPDAHGYTDYPALTLAV
ncbi:alkene reductase [Mucilaginibacter flavus]|uniref:alkene reductase n=1 Tax=Mucilaginibacter flavus TaxID=931504 RepID=UPI0025B59319|nr:alkene reductase [Mucilaginibacter flavus]MDN3581584.1 alkene reductase [Mucilaginibacter flavus]